MNSIPQHLNDFEHFHESIANRLSHYMGLSLVTIGALGVLHTLTIGSISAAWLLLIATLVLDIVIWTPVAVPIFAVGSVFLIAASQLSPLANLLVLIIGFVIQIAAHKKFEKNEPAFTTNLIHNYIGPRWLVIQWAQMLGFKLGYPNHLNLNTDASDAVRWGLSKLIPVLGRMAQKRRSSQLVTYTEDQSALKIDYQVHDKPISPYSESLRESIIRLQQEKGGAFAYTSGSTSKPKQILYPPERLKAFKKSSVLSSLQAFSVMEVNHPSMFIFASLQKDDSFASLVVKTDEERPGFLEGLIEPAKYLNHPYIKAIANEYGANGARLWVMAMNSPGAFYATNPSTLAVFFEDVDANWNTYRDMFQAFAEGRGCFDTVNNSREWYLVITRLGRSNYGKRIQTLAESAAFPGMKLICPDLKGYICWDGGYVTGFLKKVLQYLPKADYLHVPMFSMSTETMQTELLVINGKMHFVPTGDQVLYEFLPEGISDDKADQLLLATELEVGRCYTMVISDPWGLRRYQTQDIFKCVDKVNGIADLRFQKRQGLNYSFTGEKLTGEQVEEAIEMLLQANPEIRETGVQFTLVPSQEAGELPYYILLGAVASHVEEKHDHSESIANQVQNYLEKINTEYRDKVDSSRLAPLKCLILSYDDVAHLLDPKTNGQSDVVNRSWESQFKLTPITKKTWQSLPTHQLGVSVANG